MKVQAVVYQTSISEKTKMDLNTRIFNDSEADILLFPGWTFHNPVHLEIFQENLSNTKTLAFMELQHLGSRELTNALFSISKGEVKFVSFQLFATSDEIECNKIIGRVFIKQFAKERAFKVKNKVVRIMQCGELNILRNEQSNDNKAKFRFLDENLENEFDGLLQNTSLILNPQHTPMGNQGKMSRRREYLSSNNRFYISTSNVVNSWGLEKSKSAHYAYFNGQALERMVIDKGEFYRVYEYDL